MDNKLTAQATAQVAAYVDAMNAMTKLVEDTVEAYNAFDECEFYLDHGTPVVEGMYHGPNVDVTGAEGQRYAVNGDEPFYLTFEQFAELADLVATAAAK